MFLLSFVALFFSSLLFLFSSPLFCSSIILVFFVEGFLIFVLGSHFLAHELFIHFMNKSIKPGDSLYSGGVNGTGQTYVALHNAILNPSSGMKHAAHLLSFIAEKGGGRVSFPYLVLLECDGGPDHNLTFLINQISLVGVFLLGGMDKLNALRGCAGRIYSNLYSYLKDVTNTLIFLLPGMSYLNTAANVKSEQGGDLPCSSDGSQQGTIS